MTIDAAAIERFCDVVGNQGEKFKTSRNPDIEASTRDEIGRTSVIDVRAEYSPSE